MPYCPNCGRHVSLGDTSCSECGCSLSEGLEEASGSRHDRGAGREQQPTRRSRGDRGAERERRRTRRSRGDDDRRGETAAPHASDQTGKSRRKALAYAGGVLGALVLGTWALELFDDKGPKDAVEAWRTAWADGDEESYRKLWHSESPRDRTWEVFPELSAPDSSLRYVSESRELLDRTDTEASVRDVFVLFHPTIEKQRRITDVVDLRTEDGNWRIWDYRTEQSEQVDCTRSLTITGISTPDCE